MKILWKEWQQQKWLFLFGCLAGIFVPVFEMLESGRHRGVYRTNSGSAVVLVLGAAFAIILSVATTYADTRKGLDNFWQSKPIRIWRLFVTKFVVGALVLLIGFLFIMSLDFWSKYQLRNQIDEFAWAALCHTYPIALMLFAATMFLIVLLRDAAKTVLLAIWAGVAWIPLFKALVISMIA